MTEDRSMKWGRGWVFGGAVEPEHACLYVINDRRQEVFAVLQVGDPWPHERWLVKAYTPKMPEGKIVNRSIQSFPDYARDVSRSEAVAVIRTLQNGACRW